MAIKGDDAASKVFDALAMLNAAESLTLLCRMLVCHPLFLDLTDKDVDRFFKMMKKDRDEFLNHYREKAP